MKNSVLLLLFTSFLFCCKDGRNPIEETIKSIDEQIASLKTIDEQKHFLNQMYLSGQGIVEEIDSLEKNFFKNQADIYKLRRELDSSRGFNAYKAEKYLEVYSHPTDTIAYTKNEYHALYFAFLNSSKVDTMLRGLPIIQNEYENGQISSWHFLKYLTVIYYLDKTKFYQMDKSHTRDQLIQDILPEIEDIKKNRNL